jgi:hypothetical protein
MTQHLAKRKPTLGADGVFVQGFRDDVKCNCVLIVSKNHLTETVLEYNQDAFTFDIVSKVLYKHLSRF